jgi:hypothetical protein
MHAPVGIARTRKVMLLALVSWTITVAQVTQALFYPEYLMGHHLILGGVALFGLFGCLAWIGKRRSWRPMVVAAALIYLLFFALRAYALLIYPWLDQHSFLEATHFAVRVVSSLVQHHLSEGRVLQGLSELFFESFMPLLQVIVLIGLLLPSAAGSSGDTPRAGRA